MMKGHVAQALKASYLDRRAISQCSTCPRKMKWRLLKSWHGRRGVMSSDPFSLPYLLQPSTPSTWTGITKPWPRIDCQKQSCLVFARSSWPRVGHQRWPYLVLNHAAVTSIWPSMTAMLGPCTFTMTTNRLSVNTLPGPISVVELRPWVSRQVLLCLVLKWLSTSDPGARLNRSRSMTYGEFTSI